MARVRVLRRQDKAYIEIPSDLAASAEAELFQLRDGFYLLSVPLESHGKPPNSASSGISEAERQVMKRLLSIRFEKRTPAFVGKALSEEEKSVLAGLVQKRFVNVFTGDKYRDGVYNISDSIYPLLSGRAQPSREQAGEAAQPRQNSGTLSVLKTRGFVIVQDKREAMELSERLGQEMKRGEVFGVKGFDNKFYIVTRDYFTASQQKVNAALKEDMDAPSIAEAAKLDQEGCVAVLRLMAENGEIIEKKRGVFAPV